MLKDPYYETVQAWTYAPPKKLDLPGAAEPILRQYRDLITRAHRFSIDDDMVRLVASASRDRVDRLPLWIILARLPHDVCWIEFDWDVKREALYGEVHDGFGTGFNQGGFLLVRDRTATAKWTCTSFEPTADSQGRITVRPGAVVTVIDPDGSREQPVRPVKGERSIREEFPKLATNLEMSPIGMIEGPSNSIAAPDWCRYRLTTQREPLTRLVASANSEVGNAFVTTHLYDNFGHARFLLTLLAAINDVPVLLRHVEPRGRSRQVRNHNVPYLGHSVVTIKAPKSKPLDWFSRRLDSAGLRRHRRHDVRGHWRVMIDRTSKLALGRKWIEGHERGDASLGYVKKRYVVEVADEAR